MDSVCIETGVVQLTSRLHHSANIRAECIVVVIRGATVGECGFPWPGGMECYNELGLSSLCKHRPTSQPLEQCMSTSPVPALWLDRC